MLSSPSSVPYAPLRLPLRRELPFVSRLIGAPAPAVASRRAEEALPSSHIGLPTIPRPLRRGVLQRCISRCFAPSMAFAQSSQARLPLAPLAGLTLSTRQASRYVADWWVARPPHWGTLSRRFAGRFSPRSGRQLSGSLVFTRTGLSPAGRCGLVRVKPVLDRHLLPRVSRYLGAPGFRLNLSKSWPSDADLPRARPASPVGRGWRARFPLAWLRKLGVFRLSGCRVGQMLQATG